jgi:hypothetical protein
MGPLDSRWSYEVARVTRRLRSTVARAGVLGALLLGVACTDPVRDKRIEELGGEDPAVPPGPDHRPGQPCLACHSEEGPAKAKFAVAGTVYQTPSAGARGAAGVTVKFVDGEGYGPARDPVTSESGNFFVPKGDWDVAFPFRVGLYKPPEAKPLVVMQTTVNREGSCNFCHKPNVAPPYDEAGIEQNKQSIGQIYVGTTP